MNVGIEDDIYEVFARFGDNTAPISWLGSIRSGSPELAWHAAKEIYTRREAECSVLWVARRSGMVKSGPEDAEIMLSPDRLAYRTPSFPGRHRRDRSRVGDVQPVKTELVPAGVGGEASA